VPVLEVNLPCTAPEGLIDNLSQLQDKDILIENYLQLVSGQSGPFPFLMIHPRGGFTFESPCGFIFLVFLSSSMAEHAAVNRRVVGSSPTWGVFLFLGYLSNFFYFNGVHYNGLKPIFKSFTDHPLNV
jgi:hypothetical protein